MPKSRSQIQRDYRERKKAAGERELKLYLPPALHERVRRYAERLRKNA